MAQPATVIAETKHLRLVQRNGWSFVQRTSTNRVACVIAQTPSGKVLLIEQYRRPVDATVIELPAGLVGDLGDQPNETIEHGAARELFEETGYVAGQWRQLANLASCPGLTDEETTMLLATELRKDGPGGGDENENIVVHEVPIEKVDGWLAKAAIDGKMIDGRVYAGLYLLRTVS
jgi:ADP-ribose pyrophosphatase